MQVRSVSESEGGAEGDWKQSARRCPYCKVAGQRYDRAWESYDGAYTDVKSECRACSKVWWVGGEESLLDGIWRSLRTHAGHASAHPTVSVRPVLAVASACIIGFNVFREMARRIGQ